MRRTLSLLLALGLAPTALAVPTQYVHQGRLADASGSPLEGSHQITFALFDAASSGTMLWSETLTLNLEGGFFSAVLGADPSRALDAEILDGEDAWLSIAVDGAPELPTRVPIASVPYAVRALVARDLQGGVVDATEIRVNGQVVIDSSGAVSAPVSWNDLTDVPDSVANGPLADLACNPGELLGWDGAAWACTSAPASTFDASAIVSGTIEANRLPVGTGSDNVAAGDHTHDAGAVVTGILAYDRLPTGTSSGTVLPGDHRFGFADVTGSAVVSQLPVGTTSTTVARGDHTHDFRDIQGSIDTAQLPSITAQQVGALPDTGGTLSGDLEGTNAAFSGSVQVGGTSAACNSGSLGTLRWTGTRLELCTGAGWAKIAASACTPGFQVFSATGGPQNFNVPAGCDQITVKAWGGGGGAGGSNSSAQNGGNGGGAGYATATLDVTPGEQLVVYVGGNGAGGAGNGNTGAPGAGGWDGGGSGGTGDSAGSNSGSGGGGGGASRVQRSAAVLVQAGGGGGGGAAGYGGGNLGEPGRGGCTGNGLGGVKPNTPNGTNGATGVRGGGGGGSGGSGTSNNVGPGRGGDGGACSGSSTSSGSGVVAANNGDSDYGNGAGQGGGSTTGAGNGGNPGRVVVRWGN